MVAVENGAAETRLPTSKFSKCDADWRYSTDISNTLNQTQLNARQWRTAVVTAASIFSKHKQRRQTVYKHWLRRISNGAYMAGLSCKRRPHASHRRLA